MTVLRSLKSTYMFLRVSDLCVCNSGLIVSAWPGLHWVTLPEHSSHLHTIPLHRHTLTLNALLLLSPLAPYSAWQAVHVTQAHIKPWPDPVQYGLYRTQPPFTAADVGQCRRIWKSHLLLNPGYVAIFLSLALNLSPSGCFWTGPLNSRIIFSRRFRKVSRGNRRWTLYLNIQRQHVYIKWRVPQLSLISV